MARGYVYILNNASMPGLLKIGKTTRTPHARAKELSSVTGVATPFAVVYAAHVPDCGEAELLAHCRLARYRVSPDREFFEMELWEAIEVVARVAEELRDLRTQVAVRGSPTPSRPDAPGIVTPLPFPEDELEPLLAPHQEEMAGYSSYLCVLGALQLLAVVLAVVASLDRGSQRTALMLLGGVGVVAIVATCVAAAKECSWFEGLWHTVSGLAVAALDHVG